MFPAFHIHKKVVIALYVIPWEGTFTPPAHPHFLIPALLSMCDKRSPTLPEIKMEFFKNQLREKDFWY